MFDEFCKRLCLHTRAARIAFFSSLIFIVSVTLLAVFLMYEPQPTEPPSVVEVFDYRMLEAEFFDELGSADFDIYFSLVESTVDKGDRILQEYHFMRRPQSRTTITADEARRQFTQLKQTWDAGSAPLLAAENVWVRAVAEDLDEALDLALAGLSGWTPFINRRLVRARGMFHDINSVLLPSEKVNRYYGQTRLGRLVESELLP